MKSHILALSALTIGITLTTPHSPAQTPAFEDTALNAAPAPLCGINSSDNEAAGSAYVTLPPAPRGTAPTYRPFSALGLSTRVGLAGTGFDIATPLATKFNLRAGGDFFSYLTTFQEQGA
jgi:hypothetical protein